MKSNPKFLIQHRAGVTIKNWRWPAIATILGAITACCFYYYSLHFADVSSNLEDEHIRYPSNAENTSAPFVRILLGADLWNIFADDLQGDFDRRFPLFSVDTLASRSLLKKPLKPYPNEVIFLMPAEKFIAEEYYARESRADSGLTMVWGPTICQTNLVLLMSQKTHEQLLRSVATPPSSLTDWLAACEATRQQMEPVLFCMADPNTCSSSWIGLADMVSEKLDNADAAKLGDVQADDLSRVVDDLKRQIVVQGSSDRLEMYKYFLNGCPDNRILLAYQHLAEVIAQDGSSKDFVMITPKVNFHPVVRSLIVSRTSDHIVISRYLPTLMDEWTRMGLVKPEDTNFPKDQESGAVQVSGLVPNLKIMENIMDRWDSN